VRDPGDRRNRRFFVILLAICAVGFVARVAYLLWMRDLPVLSDGIHYHLGALGVADGHGFVNPLMAVFGGPDVQDAVHPPGWELVLAGASVLGLRSYLSHQLVAAAVGTGTIFMTGLAGREVGGHRAGLVAAVLAAVYANFWLYERELLSEPLAMFFMATLLWLCYRFRARPGTWAAVGVGACLGALTLTRSEQVLLGLLLVVPLVLGRTSVAWGRRLLWLGVAGGTCIAMMTPWTIYNASRFDALVPLSTGLGGSMLSGNCPPTYSGEKLGYAEFACTLLQQGVSSDPSVADGQLRSRAMSFMGDHLDRVSIVVAARLGRTFGVFRPAQQMEFETERGSELWVMQLAAGMYAVLVPLAVFGAVLARRRRVPLYPLLVPWAVIIVSSALTIGAVRYRAPTEVPLVILSAVDI
jgi:4-amino-4-deoxy-L-arabinose transferase-like glycosyltransferase